MTLALAQPAALHWGTHPRALRCQRGHAFNPARENGMSVEHGALSGMIGMVCNRCEPKSYQIGLFADCRGIVWVYWYALPDSRHYAMAMRLMDEGQYSALIELLTLRDVPTET